MRCGPSPTPPNRWVSDLFPEDWSDGNESTPHVEDIRSCVDLGKDVSDAYVDRRGGEEETVRDFATRPVGARRIRIPAAASVCQAPARPTFMAISGFVPCSPFDLSLGATWCAGMTVRVRSP